MRALKLTLPSAISFGLSVILVVLTGSPAFGTDAGEASTTNLWRKIVLVGASASAGFTASEPLGGTNTPRFRLSRYVDAAVVAPHAPVLNLANALFFLQPEPLGHAQISRALKEQPSVLLGVDFLFWYCYGRGINDAERLQRFEAGLKLLEPVACPLVLGDIPDASAAVNIMLRPDQIPTTNAMAAANTRLRAWAATRPNVSIVPLSQFMYTAARNQSLALHGLNLPAGKTRPLLQDDNLHPSPAGTAAIALATLGELKLRQQFPEHDVRWDLAALVDTVRKSLRASQSSTPKATQPAATAAP